MDKQKKTEIIKANARKDGDTGSPEVQIALLTERISHLTLHFKEHPHDFHSKRGLLQLVGKRRRLLNYFKETNLDGYRELIAKLNIRK